MARLRAATAIVLLCAILACTAVVGSSSRLASKLNGGGGLLNPGEAPAETVESVTEALYSEPVGSDETSLRAEFKTLTDDAAAMEPGSAKLSATRTRLVAVAARILELTEQQPKPLKLVKATAAPLPQVGATAADPAAAANVVNEEAQHGDQPPLDFDPWADETDQPKSLALSLVSLDEDSSSLLESYADAAFAASADKCTAKGGVCKKTSLGCSGGAFSSGLCSGASTIKCCIKKAVAVPNSSACAAKKGVCRHTATGCGGGVWYSGICAGAADIKCCAAKPKSSSSSSSSSSSGSTVAASTGSCGPLYANAPVSMIKGNGGVSFPVVAINRAHLSDPSMASKAATAADNHMLTTTACAFEAMHNAAKAAGVHITINSGFRTLARQQYFWNCYRSKKCNGGHLAAVPGTSNHGIGKATDLNASSRGVYTWLKNNAHKYGFVRTVPSETWHWEHRVGWRRAPYT